MHIFLTLAEAAAEPGILRSFGGAHVGVGMTSSFIKSSITR